MSGKEDELPPHSARPLRLLSLDGGGIRGLSSLYILKYLMKRVNPDKPPKPCDYFDLIGGTSTGGLIAIMLGRFHMDVDECIDKYLQLSSAAFQPKRSKMNVIGAVKDRLQAKGAYRSETLANEFKKVSKVMFGSEDALLLNSDKTCRIFVCAFRKALNTPVLLRSYASREDADVTSLVNCKIWEAARATSAAATFFDPINVGLHSYVDGATGHNNPVEEVLYEALSIWPDSLSRIHCIVSIGTGVPGPKDFGDDLIDVLGTLKMISTETETTAERFKKTHTLLGLTGRYFRFNVNKGLEAVRLDEHEKVKEIEAAADLYLKSQDVVVSANKLAWLAATREPDAQNEVDASERDKLLGWLPVPDPWQYHNAARRLRIDKTTGEWFLGKKFETWSTTPRSLLWLCSKAGSGKTVLSSAIIDKIRDKIQSTRSGSLAFFYFSFRNSQRQDVLAFKRSLLVQIVQQICHEKSRNLTGKRPFYIPTAFSGLHGLYYPSTEPTVEDIESTLLGVLQESSKTYIVIDAVDECLTLSDRSEVIECLERLASKASHDVHVLFTSRPESDIDDAFRKVSVPKTTIQFNPRDTDADISSHISCLMKQRHYDRWSSGLKSKVKTHLTSRADGVFRWADLQMRELAGKAREKDVEKALKRLPETLGQTYERMLQKIDRDDYGEEALLVLRWLAYSQRPLTLAETSEIAAFGLDDEGATGSNGQSIIFNSGNRFDDQWEIQRILAGLITVAARGQDLSGLDTTVNPREIFVSLPHFSVKEYLEGNTVTPEYFHLDWYTSQCLIVKASADYICQACKELDEASEEEPFPLLLYACFNIWLHIAGMTQYRGPSKTTQAPVSRLLSQYPQITDCAFLVSPKFFQTHHGCYLGNLDSESTEHGTLATEYLDKLFQSQSLDFSKYETSSSRNHPLHEAAINGDAKIAQLCLRAGVPPNDRRQQDPRLEEKYWLMEEPTNESAFETPLMLAIRHGQEEVAELLIGTRSTDVNLKNNRTMSPILQASWSGNEGIVRALLKRRDLDVNVTDIHCRNALSLAASQGHATIIQMLLDHGGIDASLRDRLGRSIFARAAKNGHERVIEILRPMVEHTDDFLDETDRQAALDTLCRGSAVILGPILESDTDMNPNSRDSWGTTILHKAAYWGYESIVQMLLSRFDIDISGADKSGLTALDWARYRGNKNVVDVLQRQSSSTRPTQDELSDTKSSADADHGNPFLYLDAPDNSVDGCNSTTLRVLVGKMPGEIWCVAFSNDGRRLATGNSEGHISIWRSDTAKQLWTLSSDHVFGIGDISWSPDDSMVVSCGRDGLASLWDPDDGVLKWTAPEVREPVSSCTWDPKGNFFLLGSFDRAESIRQVNTDNLPYSISTWGTGEQDPTAALALSRDGQKLARINIYDVIHIFDVGTRQIKSSTLIDSQPTSVSFSRDSKHVLINTQAGKVELFNIDTRNVDQFYEGPPETKFIIKAVFGGLWDKFVLSAAEGGIPYLPEAGAHIYIWDRKSGKILARPEGHRLRSNSVAWNPANPYMFSSVGDDGELKIWTISET